MYAGSPVLRASNSVAQSASGRKPLWTKRRTVVPPRPWISYANVMSRPSSPSGVVWTSRCGGSQAVIVDSSAKPPSSVLSAPPRRRSTVFVPMNQLSIAPPVVSACQASSGLASSGCSTMTSNDLAMSGLLRFGGDAGVDGDEQAMWPPVLCSRVVIPGDQGCDGFGQLLGKGRPIDGIREADLTVDRERRDPLAGLSRAD